MSAQRLAPSAASILSAVSVVRVVGRVVVLVVGRVVVGASVVVGLGGCGGEGTVAVTAFGESFIEDGIPADAVDDGWAVDFGRFEVDVRDVVVAGQQLAIDEPVDLVPSSSGAGHELGRVVVPAGEHSAAAFTIARVAVDGTATKGEAMRAFRWVFDEPTRYEACETTTVVPAGGSAVLQITVHADHLLFDSLVATTPRLLFQPLADADADADGTITPDELAAADIGAYDPGSADGVDDLWQWLNAQVRNLGHVDGEGHCRAAAD